MVTSSQGGRRGHLRAAVEDASSHESGDIRFLPVPETGMIENPWDIREREQYGY
jgi:hypothetical protein